MGRFVHINEVVKLPMLGDHDYLMRSKGRLLTWSKEVWLDMNMSTVRIPVRQFFEINKKTNTIDLPCNFLQLSSVSIMDKCGVFYPVYRNTRLHDDLTDVAAAKDCACEYKCGYKLCNTIKGYEAVCSTKCDKNPDGSDVEFECVDRKAIDEQGFLYEQKQYPERVYLSGVWTSTIKKTENIKLCKVEVDSNGCCCDTEENVHAVCDACGISENSVNPPVGGDANCPPNKNDKTWIYYCNSKMDWLNVQCGSHPVGLHDECNNIYNISELGNRLIFPHNFGYDKVMVRFYVDVNLNDLYIPRVAVDTFVNGLIWFDNKYSTNPQRMAIASQFGQTYARMKFGLFREFNKYTIAELGKIIAPPKHIPSYTLGSMNNFYIGYTRYGNDTSM